MSEYRNGFYITKERMKNCRMCDFCHKENVLYVKIEGENYGRFTMALCDRCLKSFKEEVSKL